MISNLVSPNTSADQLNNFNIPQSLSNIKILQNIIKDETVYSCVAVGSVQFFTEPGKPTFSIVAKPTSSEIYKYLDEYLEEAISLNYKHFIVFNGANDSKGEQGTTETTSNWVFLRSKEALYKSLITIQCIGLAPYERKDMDAIWKEEQNITSNKTFITGRSSKDRQIILGNLATKANKILVCEGAYGTLNELITIYRGKPSIFNEVSFIIQFINSAFLINTVIPTELKKQKNIDSDTIAELHKLVPLLIM